MIEKTKRPALSGAGLFVRAYFSARCYIGLLPIDLHKVRSDWGIAKFILIILWCFALGRLFNHSEYRGFRYSK